MDAVSNQRHQYTGNESGSSTPDNSGNQNVDAKQTNLDKSVARDKKLFRCLVGKSSAMQKVRHDIEQVANSDANVLILGQSGT